MSITPIVSRLAFSLALVLATSANASVAHAETAAPTSKPPSSGVVARAEAHFKRGIELYNEGNTSAAMVEFRRAYELAPRFQILYNMAQVAYALNDYAAALDLFERYLTSGGDAVPEDRRKAVAEDIKRLRLRLGRIQVLSDVPGARLSIDDVGVGVVPNAPVAVSMGRRKLSLTAPDGRTATQFVDVPAGETVSVRFPLKRSVSPDVSASPVVTSSARAPERGLSTGAIVAWSVAGGLAVGALAAGAYAVKRAGDLDDAKQAYPVQDPQALKELDDSVSRSAMLADGLAIGAAISGAVGLWLTLRDAPESSNSTTRSTARKVTPSLSLTGISLQGNF